MPRQFFECLFETAESHIVLYLSHQICPTLHAHV
jgi:hypothetical protein